MMAWTWCRLAGSSLRRSFCDGQAHQPNVITRQEARKANKINAHLDHGDQIGEGLAAARDSLDDHVLVPAEDLETRLLHGRRLLKAHGREVVEHPWRQARGEGVP